MAENAKITDDWAFEEEFAAENKLSRRAVARMRAAPDGLPYGLLGKRIIIHIPTAREWFLARMIRPNPRRAGGEGSRSRASGRSA